MAKYYAWAAILYSSTRIHVITMPALVQGRDVQFNPQVGIRVFRNAIQLQNEGLFLSTLYLAKHYVWAAILYSSTRIHVIMMPALVQRRVVQFNPQGGIRVV